MLVLNASDPHASKVLFHPRRDATQGVVLFPTMGGVVVIEVIKYYSYATARYCRVLPGWLVGIILAVRVNANKPLVYCFPEVALATEQEVW